MKYIIKLFTVVIAFTMTTELFAQNFSVKAGLNLSNMLIKDDVKTYSEAFKLKPGFHFGATAEFPLSEMFSFETGMLLSTKGYKIREDLIYNFVEILTLEKEINPLYLDIPLTAKATFRSGEAKIYCVFGPYVGIGLSGKTKFKKTIASTVTESKEEDIEWGSDKEKSDIKRLDFGLTMGAGVEKKAILFSLTYSMGLANISPFTDGGAKANNRVLGLSVGYKFGRK